MLLKGRKGIYKYIFNRKKQKHKLIEILCIKKCTQLFQNLLHRNFQNNNKITGLINKIISIKPCLLEKNIS